MKTRILLTALLLLVSVPALAATEIIRLQYRMAEEMLPMAHSVLGDAGRVNAYGDQLIVNAPAAHIEELRDLLKQLDTPPRRLLISIDSSDSSTGERRGYRVDGSLGTGNVEIQAGRGQVHGENRIRILNRSTDGHGGALQQIQATEGYPALIQSGQSVPLRDTQVGPYGQVYRETRYRDVTRGIYATARISGDIVHVTLSSNNDRLDPSRPGVIDVQTLDTQVSGRLGEWIEIGNLSESRHGETSGLLRQRSESTVEERAMRLRVEILE